MSDTKTFPSPRSLFAAAISLGKAKVIFKNGTFLLPWKPQILSFLVRSTARTASVMFSLFDFMSAIITRLRASCDGYFLGLVSCVWGMKFNLQLEFKSNQSHFIIHVYTHFKCSQMRLLEDRWTGDIQVGRETMHMTADGVPIVIDTKHPHDGHFTCLLPWHSFTRWSFKIQKVE